MSFGFVAVKEQWNAQRAARQIIQAQSLGEITVTGYPAYMSGQVELREACIGQKSRDWRALV